MLSYILLVYFFILRETRIDLVAKVVDQLTHLQNEHISCEGQVSQVYFVQKGYLKLIFSVFKCALTSLNVMFVLQWNAEITHYNETKEKELSLVEEVDSKVKELRQTISDLNLEQVKLRTSIRKLKEKTAEMDKEVR